MSYIMYSILSIFICLHFYQYGNSIHKNSPPAEPFPSFQYWYDQALSIENNLKQIRKDLHKVPEPMLEEYKTSAYIKSKLTEYGIPYIEGWAKNPNSNHPGTGITADIGTGESPCILLRCDIDALPIPEETGLEFKSEHEAFMHACGHDAHISWLLGAGYILNKNKDVINGTVRLMFQSGQEGAGGAKLFLDEGLLDMYPPIQEVYGFHVATGVDSFKLITVDPEYTTYAAGTDFSAKFSGLGGASYNNHKTNHPLQATLALYNYLYDYQSYRSDHDDPSLIVSTILRTIDSPLPYVVPHQVEIMGTFRALSEERMDDIENVIRRAGNTIAELYGCTFDFKSPAKDLHKRYPTYSPDLGLLKYVNELLEVHSLNQTFVTNARDMGSEDVGFITSKVPSMFISFGMGTGEGQNGQGRTDLNPHSPWFNMDDRVLPYASAIMSHLATQTLGDLNKSNL